MTGRFISKTTILLVAIIGTGLLSQGTAYANRYYSPEQGRFVSRDPAGYTRDRKADVGPKSGSVNYFQVGLMSLSTWPTEKLGAKEHSLNLYEYVDSQPIQITDPRGLVPWYGNYCGPGSIPGAPIDAVDAACQAHDACYGACGVAGVWGVVGPSLCARACDRTMCVDQLSANCGWGLKCNAARAVIAGIFCYCGTKMVSPILF